MTARSRKDDLLTAEVILTLQATQPVPREALEEATMHVEDVLIEHMADISDGASASANFEASSIEIDMLLSGSTQADIHQQIAQVLIALDKYCALKLGIPKPRREKAVQSLAVTSSAAQFVRRPVPA
jgi:hypothetical protein